jgi:hypothetical protein
MLPARWRAAHECFSIRECKLRSIAGVSRDYLQVSQMNADRCNVTGDARFVRANARDEFCDATSHIIERSGETRGTQRSRELSTKPEDHSHSRYPRNNREEARVGARGPVNGVRRACCIVCRRITRNTRAAVIIAGPGPPFTSVFSYVRRTGEHNEDSRGRSPFKGLEDVLGNESPRDSSLRFLVIVTPRST